MIIDVRNAEKISDYIVEKDVRNADGIYYYITYAKGGEGGIKFTFKVQDEKDTSAQWFYLVKADGSLYEAQFDGTLTDFVLAVPLPQSVDKVRIYLEYVNPSGGEGDVSMFVNLNMISV